MATEIINITDDAAVSTGATTTNYNGAAFYVGTAGGAAHSTGSTYRTFIKLPAGTIDRQKATLRLTRSGATSADTLRIYRVLADWNEGTITHGTAPATEVVRSVDDPGGADGSTLDIDVSEVLDKTNFGLMILRGAQANFHSSEATTVSFRPVVEYSNSHYDSFSITDDTSTYGGTNAATNYGTNTNVATGGTSPAYAWFRLPTPALAAGEEITSVRLVLTHFSARTAGPIEVHRVDGAWTETAITHNNRPATTLIKTVNHPAVSATMVTEIDITGADYSANGVMLFRNDGEFFQFYASEHADVLYRPKVVYETNATMQTIDITDDTYVRNDSAGMDVNYGTGATMPFGDFSGIKYHAYVKLPAHTPETGKALGRAALSVVNEGGARSAGTIDVYSLGAAWDEATLTWNNQPARTLAKNSATPAQAVDERYEIDVTGADATNGLALWRTGGGSNYYSVHTSDATNAALRPKVVYTMVTSTNAPVTFNALPMTANSSMPDATVSGTVGVSVGSQPMTANAATTDATVATDANITTTYAPATAAMPDATSEGGMSVYALSMTATAEAMGVAVTAGANTTFNAEPMTADAAAGEFSTIGSDRIMPAGTGMSATAETFEPTVTVQQGPVIKAAAMTATARWIKPALVQEAAIVEAETDDPFFVRVMADRPLHAKWWRLNDTGAYAVERIQNIAGDVNLNGRYHGVIVGRNDGPSGRHSVYFDGTASIEQIEPEYHNDEGLRTSTVGYPQSTLEFYFRTTKKTAFLMAGADRIIGSIGSSYAGPRQIALKDGKIAFGKDLQHVGFTNLADGHWHQVVIKGADAQAGYTGGTEVFIDGKFEIRRVGDHYFTGFPDWVGSRPEVISGQRLPLLPTSENFVGDMSEIVFYEQKRLSSDEIGKHLYDFMAWSPINVEPMTVNAAMPDGSTGKGNRKKALYLYWGPQDRIPNYDPFPGLVKDYGASGFLFDPVGQLEGFMVFAMPVYPNTSKEKFNYRDIRTDRPTLIDLEQHIDINEYDAIMFKDWPDSSNQIDGIDKGYPGERERLINQLLKVNREKGVGLMVTHPRLAVDLGIIDRVDFVPTLRESKHSPEQGEAGGHYDYGAAVKFPWPIVASSGLEGLSGAGSAFNGAAHNLDPVHLANKAFYYKDQNFNNRFRVRALVEGLTDIPSFNIQDAIFHKEKASYGNDFSAFKYLRRMDGLRIGDEFMIHGSNPGESQWWFGRASTAWWGRPTGYYATPPGHVKAGLVVTTFGATHWLDKSEVENPYKDYATTIVLQPGDALRGKPVGGKIFVNFTEQPNRNPGAVGVQILPGSPEDDGTAVWPNAYSQDTPAQREWDWSGTRQTYSSTTVGGGGGTSVVLTALPTGGFEAVQQYADSLKTINIRSLFKTKVYPRYDMVRRGIVWLTDSVEVAPGDKRTLADTLNATAAMPTATVVAERDVTTSTTPATALAVMPKVAEDASGDIDIYTLPMTARTTFTGYGRTISAAPMTASAELVENLNMVHASGEQIVLTLHGEDATLFMKEET